MKPQTLYRGSDNKKEKPTKMEKAYKALQARNRRILASSSKKEVTA